MLVCESTDMNKKLLKLYANAQAQHLLDQRYSKPQELYKFVCPIYNQRNHRISHVGSAVLFKCCDRRFLATAAHVVDNLQKELLLPATNSLKAYSCSFRKTISKKSNDEVDLAFSELKDVDLGDPYDFWDISNSEIDRRPRLLREYIYIGFPSSRNKPKMSMRTVSQEQRMYINLDATSVEYQQLKVNPKSHIAIRFTKDALISLDSTKPVSFPDPTGMSGGGVWCWDIAATGHIEMLTLVPKLAGIIIGRSGRNQYWVATRINYLIEALALFAPELSEHIPLSTTFRPKIEMVSRTLA